MLRREHHEGAAEERVGSRGEDGDPILARDLAAQREGDLRALGAADPVALHQLDRLGIIDAVEVEQLVGVGGGAEHPLFHLLRFDDLVATFADANPFVVANDLLVGEHGAAGRAEVAVGQGAIGQAVLVQLEEPPLGPAVVLGIGGGELTGPVERRAHRLELAGHVLDVGVGPLLGMRLVVDRRVLGGQTEGVEAQGKEDVLALHPLPTGGNVGRRHGEPVADVQVAAGVGQHREEVIRLARVVVVDPVEAVDLPALAPARLDLGGVVGGDLRSRRRRCRHSARLHGGILWLAVRNAANASSTAASVANASRFPPGRERRSGTERRATKGHVAL